MSDSPKDFFNQISEVKKVLKNKELIIFLDYDGTLTPIVATPDLALLSEDIRGVVKNVAGTFKSAIVSGRATDDVKSKVGVAGLFYAGSHGFEICDPNDKVYINEQVSDLRKELEEVFKTLRDRLRDIDGALVEDVKYTVSVHYRQVSEDDLPVVEAAVQATLDKYSKFKMTNGKKVFEIRPDVDWDKGKAVEWILNALEFDFAKNIAIYIGDDATDEDAFAVLDGKGFGILVAEEVRLTKAHYRIKNPGEVKDVLEFFIKHYSI